MVLNDGGGPLAQPFRQWRREERPFFGVSFEELPLGFVRSPRIVEHRLGNGDLADIVKERRPSEPVPVLSRQVETVRDEISEDADPFGMSARQAVVFVEGSGQAENSLRRHRRLVVDPFGLCGANLAFECPCTARPASHGHAIRGTVGKHQGHSQQRRQRECPAGQAGCSEIDHPRRNDDQGPPGDLAPSAPGLRNEVDESSGDCDGDDDREQENRNADEAGQPGTSGPSITSFGPCTPASLLWRVPTHS